MLFIGEAPGDLENTTGVPFVGISGKILNQLFKLVHFQFQYLITNVVGCRPVDICFMDSDYDKMEDFNLNDYVLNEDYDLQNYNREPTKAEIEHCKPHIDELIESFKPHGVVYLGKIAESYTNPKRMVPVSALLEPDAKLYKHTNLSDEYCWRHLPTLSLHHPAYIARMEYKLLPLKHEARKLELFLERFITS